MKYAPDLMRFSDKKQGDAQKVLLARKHRLSLRNMSSELLERTKVYSPGGTLISMNIHLERHLPCRFWWVP